MSVFTGIKNCQKSLSRGAECKIEDWFKTTYDTPIDFEIEDALGKLKRLKLCEITGTADTGQPVWRAIALTEACERLDFLWDNFFQMHAPHA
jgi:hypothetical protein